MNLLNFVYGITLSLVTVSCALAPNKGHGKQPPVPPPQSNPGSHYHEVTREPGELSLAMPIHASSEEASASFSPEFFTQPEENRTGRYYEYPYMQQVPLITYNESSTYGNGMCPRMEQFHPDFDAQNVFPRLGFHDSWIRQKWFWNAENFDFEQRYKNKFHSHPTLTPPRIKVFVVPHSHSDPGWLKTFEGYFHSQVKYTLDYTVEKLMLYPNMTFVWNEISFLSLWWQRATPSQKVQFLQLVKEGRLEVLTGSWVMADEACVNLYGLMDEIIEGRQWTYNYLGIVPNISWSIDPFGHGSTVPYLMKSAGINNMVIQRLHYAWKKYLAQHEYGNFKWVQRWDSDAEFGITCHNAPYDVYTTKHTCGPDPYICLRVDFRNIIGEYSEYVQYSRPVREVDLEALAKDLVGQFQRTASLTQSRVVLFPLGDDFRFDKAEEWDQQYENYVPLLNQINRNYHQFGVSIQFGTVSDYFRALESENLPLPKFSGDFFPYSDVFVSARPAYWTGFYGTRPYWKKLYRETENHLRTAEILFTYAYNLALGDPVLSVILRQEYTNLAQARKHLALFAHHDGATGTSRRATMEDYGHKLMEATRSATRIQRQSIRAIMLNGLNVTISALGIDRQVLAFGELPKTTPRMIYDSDTITKKIVLFNSLSFKRIQLVKVHVTSPLVKVVGPNRESIVSQISPVVDTDGEEIVFKSVFELSFLAELDPLTLHLFEIRKVSSNDFYVAKTAHVSCTGCRTANQPESGSYSYFDVENKTSHTIVIGNREQELYFNGSTGFLRRVIMLQDEVSIPVKVQFGGYESIFRDSGAYLLKPDTESDVKIPYNDTPSNLLIVEGPVTSYVASFNDPLRVTTRLLGRHGQGIHVENIVDLGTTAAEVYMRIDTWLNSTTTSTYGMRQPTMYTDQNGYTMERRVKVPSIGYPGNVYPVNTMAYIQDTENLVRFSVLVDRTHGLNSMQPGRMETLIERRTVHDDGRGMAEGVLDNKPTISNYIFMVERIDSPEGVLRPEDPKDYRNNLPTLAANRLSLGLVYPSNTFGYDDNLGGYLGKYAILSKPLPEDSHLLNLRTISNISRSLDQETPSQNALLIVQKLGYLKTNGNETCPNRGNKNSDLFQHGTRFTGVDINSADVTDLAGVIGVQYTGRRSILPIVERKPFEITSLYIAFQSKPKRQSQPYVNYGHGRKPYSYNNDTSSPDVYEKA